MNARMLVFSLVCHQWVRSQVSFSHMCLRVLKPSCVCAHMFACLETQFVSTRQEWLWHENPRAATSAKYEQPAGGEGAGGVGVVGGGTGAGGALGPHPCFANPHGDALHTEAWYDNCKLRYYNPTSNGSDLCNGSELRLYPATHSLPHASLPDFGVDLPINPHMTTLPFGA